MSINSMLTLLQVLASDSGDEDEVDDLGMELKPTTDYLKMLQDLENLALFRGNEVPFKALDHAIHNVKAILRHEHNASLEQTTIDNFFKPKGPTWGLETPQNVAKDLEIEISDSNSDASMVSE